MANNPYVNKVVYGGDTLIDLTGDTVTADKLIQGYTAHNAAGLQITGTAQESGGSVITITDEPDSHGGTIRHINAVSLDGDTVTAGSMLSGVTAHDSDGNAITGTIGAPVFEDTPTVSYDARTGIFRAISELDTAGYLSTDVQAYFLPSDVSGLNDILEDVIITPTEAQQTAATYGDFFDGGEAIVEAIPSNYVGSGITRRSSASLSASGDTVSVPAGYYATSATKTVGSGTAATPNTTITSNPTISVDSSGLITATTSATKSVTPTVQQGYVTWGTAGTITVSGSNTSQLSTQAAATITPTTSSQTAVAAGKYTTGAVTVGPIPSEYIVPSGTLEITENDTYDVTQYASVDVNVSGGTPENPFALVGDGNTHLWVLVGRSGSPVFGVRLSKASASGSPKININWGDGTSTLNASAGSISHTYPYAGLWHIKVYWDGVGSIKYSLDQTFAYSTYPYQLLDVISAEIGNLGTGMSFAFGSNTSSASNFGSGLKTVYFKPGNTDSTTTFGTSYMFARSGCLENATLLNSTSATELPSYMFYECRALRSVTVPSNITTIGSNAFQDCSNLSSITLPTNLVSIGAYAFDGTYGMKFDLTLPNTVTTIGNYAFRYCGITYITIPGSVTSIGNYAFQGSRVSGFTIGEGVQTLGTYMFANCTALDSTKVMSIPSTVTDIPNYMFNNCTGTNFTSFTVPNTITTIGNSVFYGCTKLTSITIGSGVTSMGTNMFYNNTSLTELHMRPTSPPTISSNTLSGVPSSAVIYVPSASLNTYKAAQYWSSKASQIQAEP